MSTEIKKINLRKLELSPIENPLLEPQRITTKRRAIQSGRGEELIDPLTGELKAVSVIKTIEERDDEEFVKVFAAGVAGSYELTKTAQRVFQVVLDQYQRTPMSGGYADAVNLLWFGVGIEGRDVGMSEKTFQRGLKELLAKKFIAPKDGVSYWVNPALFFKGDRVVFLKEYRRKTKPEALSSAHKDVEESIEGGVAKQNDPYTGDLLNDQQREDVSIYSFILKIEKALDTHRAKLTAWEIDFLNSLLTLNREKGVIFSQKQNETAQNIIDRVGK